LFELEPNSANWAGQSALTLFYQAQLLVRSGLVADARAATQEGCAITDRLIAKDPSVIFWRDQSRQCLRLRAELAAIGGSRSEAILLANQVLAAVRSDVSESSADRFALPQAYQLVGDVLWKSGDRSGAAAAWKAGLASWPRGIAETPMQMAVHGEMLRGSGQRAEGVRIATELAAMGYRRSMSNRTGI
jgi:hypothetical protein